jgi:hypothetical protein
MPDIDLNQNRIRTPNEMTDAAPRREKAPRKGVEPGAIRFRRTLTARRETHLPLDKLAGRRASYRLYFWPNDVSFPPPPGFYVIFLDWTCLAVSPHDRWCTAYLSPERGWLHLLAPRM